MTAMTIMMLEEEEKVEGKEVKAKREGKEEEERGEEGNTFKVFDVCIARPTVTPQGPRCSLTAFILQMQKLKPRERKPCA